MAGHLTLKSLAGPKGSCRSALAAVLEALGGAASIVDAAGKPLLGEAQGGPARVAVEADGVTIGWIAGSEVAVNALAVLLQQLVAQELERRALAGEVLSLYREVHLIEQLSEQLAAMLELSSIGDAALDQARRLIAGSRGGIFLSDSPDARLRPIASFGERGPEAPPLAKLVTARGVADIANAQQDGSESFICVPLRARQRTVGAIAIAHDDGVQYTAANLKLLNTIALQTSAAIENSLLCAEMLGAVRDREQLAALQKELDTARTIQHSLIPRIFPPFPERTDFEIHAQMTAAGSVGGDFFDSFLIDANRLCVVIGDVSGKGVPAALYMAVTRTQIKSTVQQGILPEDCLREVNRVLVVEKASSMYATCFYGILDLASGEFRYCNAGHNPPYVVRAAGGPLEPLNIAGGLPLGLFGGMPYSGTAVQLAPGDAIFLFTDGVPEANNGALDEFSEERLEGLVLESGHLPCREMVDTVAGEVLAFTAGAPQFDDITMVSVRISARPGPIRT